jgi:hypothetical protein
MSFNSAGSPPTGPPPPPPPGPSGPPAAPTGPPPPPTGPATGPPPGPIAAPTGPPSTPSVSGAPGPNPWAGRTPLLAAGAVIVIGLLAILTSGGSGDGNKPATALDNTPTSAASPFTTPGTGPSTTAALTGSVSEIEPTSVSATSTAPDGVDAAGRPVSYGPSRSTDGDPGTAWRTTGDGIGVTLTLALPDGVTVTEVGLLPGYAKVDPVDGTNRFFENRRILRVRYRFDSSAGSSEVEAAFQDRADVQFTDVGKRPATVLSIDILETTPNPSRDYTAISEIQLRGIASSS